ncbi:MAG: DegV family protein [Candidatus Dormibacteraeota bacterium]|nr:DegV family protein [Candidatus Dormibacteraeota bacterium]
MSVRVVCDSTADLDAAFLEAHNVEVVPLKVIIGEEEYRDGIDITPAQLYARMRQDGVAARTSQPTPMDFESVFRAATDSGDSVVCTTISSELSGTFASATQARQMLEDRDIRVVDSRSVAVGHYAIAAAAVRAAERGASASDVVAALERAVRDTTLLFTVETLEYLRRGGRIGGARALLGSMLDVKPILKMREGRIEPIDRVRTYRRALDACAAAAEQAASEWGGALAFIGHADAEAAAESVAGRLSEYEPPVTVTTVEVGPVIGVHGGPGAVGVAFHPPLSPDD